MNLPKNLSENIKNEHIDGIFPLIEIELKGDFYLKQIIETLQNRYKIPYNIIKADIEYSGKANFGKILIHLKGKKESNDEVIQYFMQSKITTQLRGYAA